MEEKELIQLRKECIEYAIKIAPTRTQQNESIGIVISEKDSNKVIEIADKLYNWVSFNSAKTKA